MGKLISVTQQKILSYIKDNPKCTRKEIANSLNLLKDSVKNNINNLLAKRAIVAYNTRRPAQYVLAGYVEQTNIPEEQTEMQDYATTKVEKHFDGKVEIKRKALENATPRELMLELKKRGFTGTLKLVTINEINLSNLR